MTRRQQLLSALAGLAVVAAACTAAEPIADAAGPDMSEDMVMDITSPMNMGDPDATPADEVRNANLTTAVFELLDTAPEGYARVTGTAHLARYETGTTVTIELTGLPANTEFVSHVHAGTCAEDGGPHFMFDDSGPAMPPNEIHLAFTSDGAGHGFMTAENAQTVGDDARSVVVHPVRSTSTKVACAEF